MFDRRKMTKIAAFAAVLLFAVLALAPAASAQEKFKVRFSYSPNVAPKSVTVAGTFNEWNKDACPMKEVAGGAWECELEIPAGTHQYKFVVNEVVWIADPANMETSEDGHGGRNSVITVGGGFFKLLEKMSPSDDTVEAEGLAHKQQEARYLDFVAERRVRVTLRSFKNDISSASLVLMKDEKSRPENLPMVKFACDGMYDYFKAYVEGADTQCAYLFSASSGKNSRYFGYKGLMDDGSEKSLRDNAFHMPDSLFKRYTLPYWWPDAVFYQIFPDRFFDGDPFLNQKFVKDWGAKPSFDNFTGGDLEGVRKKLGHIVDLGANAIYFNPIFKSNSNHKYDTIDYYTIDETFGTTETLIKLVKDAHEKGIKIILDGVFNHTSTDFFAFADVRANGEKSKYATWYNFKSFPVDMQRPNYDCWWNNGALPKLNLKNADVYNYLLKIPEFWIKTAGVDGFRLDVPNELPHMFWKDFRRVVKDISKEYYIVGEIWADSSPWLQGDEFDATMNYLLRNALISFFVKRDFTALKLDETLARIRVSIPESAFYSMLNLLDSHDTPRFLTSCGNDSDILKSAVAFVMTYPGAPCVYYGDETGMQGDRDPDNRRCMEWDDKKWKTDIFDFYKKMISLRKENAELTRGDLFTLQARNEGDIYAFARVSDKAAVVCAFSRATTECEFETPAAALQGYAEWKRGSAASLKDAKAAVRDLVAGAPVPFDDKSGSLKMKLAPKGFAIYKIDFTPIDKK